MGRIAIHYDPVDVIPAYGRRYKDSQEAVNDWYSGMDFMILGGPYMSIRDTQGLIAGGYSHVRIIDVPTMEIVVVLRLGSL